MNHETDKNLIRHITASSKNWATGLIECATKWDLDTMMSYFMVRPWGTIGTSFFMCDLSRQILEMNGCHLNEKTLHKLLEVSQEISGTKPKEETVARFERIILTSSQGPTVSSDLEMFLLDALLLSSSMRVTGQNIELDDLLLVELTRMEEALPRLKVLTEKHLAEIFSQPETIKD
jgi:hypothetical protein